MTGDARSALDGGHYLSHGGYTSIGGSVEKKEGRRTLKICVGHRKERGMGVTQSNCQQ